MQKINDGRATMRQRERVLKTRHGLTHRNPQETTTVLEKTAGLWHGKKLDPLAYQRKMRKSYETIRTT